MKQIIQLLLGLILLIGCEKVVVKKDHPPKKSPNIIINRTEQEKPEHATKPSPPPVLDIWLYIHHGKVVKNRITKIDYPGNVKKLMHKKTRSGYVVILMSTYDQSVRWELLLPQNDGEHYVKAYLKR